MSSEHVLWGLRQHKHEPPPFFERHFVWSAMCHVGSWAQLFFTGSGTSRPRPSGKSGPNHTRFVFIFTFILDCLEQFSIECRKTKTKVITLASHKGRRAIHCPIKTRSNYTKRGKSCASKSQLVLVLLLIGRESGASFFKPITKRSNAKPKKTQITFDTQVKTAVKALPTYVNIHRQNFARIRIPEDWKKPKRRWFWAISIRIHLNKENEKL